MVYTVRDTFYVAFGVHLGKLNHFRNSSVFMLLVSSLRQVNLLLHNDHTLWRRRWSWFMITYIISRVESFHLVALWRRRTDELLTDSVVSKKKKRNRRWLPWISEITALNAAQSRRDRESIASFATTRLEYVFRVRDIRHCRILFYQKIGTCLFQLRTTQRCVTYMCYRKVNIFTFYWSPQYRQAWCRFRRFEVA